MKILDDIRFTIQVVKMTWAHCRRLGSGFKISFSDPVYYEQCQRIVSAHWDIEAETALKERACLKTL